MRYFIIILLWLPVFCLGAEEKISSREYGILKKAYERLQNEQYEDCLGILSSLLGADSPPSYSFSYAAQASGSLNRFAQAITFLKQGTILYPEKRNLWHNLGNYQMQADDFPGAIQTYKKLIAMEKENPEPIYQYYLSFAWYRLENYEKALEAITKITKGKKEKRHYLLLQLHCQIALGKWQACEETTRRLIRLNPTGAENWNLFGRIAINRMDYDRAAAALEIRDILKKKQKPDKMLGHLYRVLSAWNEVARLQGDYHCAKNLFLAGQYRQAAEVLDSEHRNMEKSYLHGRILFALGRNKEAVNSLLKAQNEEHLFLETGRKKMSLQEKRHKKDALRGRALLLAGQINWLDKNWVAARDLFKKLAILPGQEQLGNSLADCLQFYLNETRADQALPGLYDPPLVIVRPDNI
jgi:tetratricopeptide (TPR) repeat protein